MFSILNRRGRAGKRTFISAIRMCSSIVTRGGQIVHSFGFCRFFATSVFIQSLATRTMAADLLLFSSIETSTRYLPLVRADKNRRETKPIPGWIHPSQAKPATFRVWSLLDEPELAREGKPELARPSWLAQRPSRLVRMQLKLKPFGSQNHRATKTTTHNKQNNGCHQDSFRFLLCCPSYCGCFGYRRRRS
jgi:hypothetical protein